MPDYQFLDKIKEAEALALARLDEARRASEDFKTKAREDADLLVADAWDEAEAERRELFSEAESKYRAIIADASTTMTGADLDDNTMKRLAAKIGERIVERIGSR